ISTVLWGVLVFALDAWAIGRTLSRGHGVQGTITWIVTILAFPVLGVVAFFLLASPGVKRVALRKRKASQALRRALGAAEAASREPGEALVELAAALTGLEPSAGNQATLLSD